ncbi:MAG: polysaccharide deacetylase family protein [Pseudonocardia sp.]|nr:polysaccharide deacetylase family protein [Pseudonocardia sp.]
MTSSIDRIAVGVLAAVGAELAPAVTAFGPLRCLTPQLAGVGDPGHIALTFDDGPDPRSTPFLLSALRAADVRATFFVLGGRFARASSLGRELAAEGHEVAIHGWDHRCLALLGPRSTYRSLAAACDLVAEQTGQRPRWFRPPYGVFTSAAIVAASRLGLTPVLWTDWGRDWSRRATGQSVFDTLTRRLRGGATVLLHDADSPTATPGAWRSTCAALPRFLGYCRQRGLEVGRLDAHGLAVSNAGSDLGATLAPSDSWSQLLTCRGEPIGTPLACGERPAYQLPGQR